MLFSKSTDKQGLHRVYYNSWFSPALLAGLFIMIITGYLWLMRENAFKQNMILLQEDAASVAEIAGLHLESEVEYLKLLAEEKVRGAVNEQIFQEKVSKFVQDNPGLINVTWADSDFVIRWTAPYGPNKQVIGLKLTLPEPERASYMAYKTRRSVYTKPFEVIQGEPAFEVYVPVFKEEEFLGTFGGIYSVEKFLLEVIPQQVINRNHVSFLNDSGASIVNLPATALADRKLSLKVSLDPPGHGVSVQLSQYKSLPHHGFGELFLGITSIALAMGMAWGMYVLRKDIKQRMLIENALVESEEKFRNLAEKSPNMIFINQSGKIVYANEKCEEIMGYTREEYYAPGFNFLSLIAPEYKDLAVENSSKYKNGEEIPPSEYQIITKDGKRITGIHTTRLIKYGGVNAILWIVTDITDRKNMEEALRVSETKYRRLVEGSPDLIYIFSNNRGGIYYSPRFEDVLGYSNSYLLENPFIWHNLIHPDDIAEVDRAIEDFYKGKCYKIEYRIKDSRGNWHWFLDRFIGKKTQGDEIIIEGLATDITDQKKSDVIMRESKERFENAFEFAAIGMALTATDGRWFCVNQPFCEITGYSKEEMENMGFKDITYPEDLDEDLDYVRQILSGEIKTFQMEKRYIHKSGRLVWVFISVSLLRDENGTPLYFIAQIQDINEQKKTRQELIIAKEKAENATKIKDKFVSLVAHDLRSPVNSISRLLELLLSDITVRPPEEQKKFLEIASGSARKMQKLIDDILSMSRLKAGMIKPRFRFLTFYDLSLKTLKHFEYLADQKGITLLNDINHTNNIFTDQTLLEQVLDNLLSNAIKFSKAGDTVTVFIPEEEPSTIAVADSGTGIHPRMVDDIFDYGKTTSVVGTAGEMGTGFGLPLSRDIMIALGGDLTVESTYGTGSVFYAKLPYIRPRILIVDDEEAFRLEQEMHLMKLGVEIINAGNGKEALAKIKKEKPHLIITDISMPFMDGIELLERVKADPATDSIPVIIVTAFKGMDIRDKVFKKGADDFVPKPFEPEELVPRVKRFLW